MNTKDIKLKRRFLKAYKVTRRETRMTLDELIIKYKLKKSARFNLNGKS